ncbi:MAG TPA: Fe-S cluster assembly protein SufD [Caldithrix abyssi]|uniref:Fe-S cluster assembly protein SufD n=1 Tax=Caldithrix abyssi TaxID=187145 RepID=A0A7V4UEI7_CALAY|nr:Fe-S cluster assembly protein SufD [Caldithrix abyssi]
MDTKNIIEHFSNLYAGQIDSGKIGLAAIRDEAFARFSALGFPKPKDEEWRFTDISPLLDIPFTQASDVDESGILAQSLDSFWIPDVDGPKIVVANGVLSKGLSQRLNNLPFKISSVYDAKQAKVIAEFVKNSPAADSNGFTALNTSLMRDALFLDVPANTNVREPVQILFLSSGSEKPQAIFPRLIVRIGRNSRMTLIESYASRHESIYFVNGVSDIHIEENASLHHVRLQADSASAFHIGHSFVEQKQDSRYQSCSISIGSRISRHHISAILDGSGAETRLDGLYLGKGEQLLDNHTLIDHKAAHCQSHELYRGVLADKARGVFSGKILVERNAQKTDAIQNNNGLLLSEEARIDSKPQLEIYADDVRCTHGATVGQLDDEALFYLKSRGIGHNTAKGILIYAFAEEALKNIESKPIRTYVDGILNRFFREVNT